MQVGQDNKAIVGRKSRVSELIKMEFRTIAIVALWYGPREQPRFPILCSIFEEHSKLILGAWVLAPITSQSVQELF